MEIFRLVTELTMPFRSTARFTILQTFLVGCFVSAQAVSAADESPPPAASVTVTAPRPPTAQELAGESVPHFIAHHARVSPVLGKLTRWRVGICPETRGLDARFDAYITARIRAVALKVGAPVLPEDKCDVNVQISFTSEPQKLMDEIAKQPILLGFHYASQTKKLAQVTHPIQGWYITHTRGVDGTSVVDHSVPVSMWGSADAGTNALHAGTVPPCGIGSRIITICSSGISNALVVADTRKVVGYTVESIADYLTVMVLTMVESQDSCDPLPSILNLMASDCREGEKPDTVTAGDLAYLKALYQTNLELAPEVEKSEVLTSMMQQFGSW
jgi:hypothetical protein